MMKLWTRTGALALSLALVGGCLTGCSQESQQPAFTAPEAIDLTTVTDPYKAISGMDGDTVVATVGEVEITVKELLYNIVTSTDSLMQYYSMYGLGNVLPWDSETDDGTLSDTILKRALETAALYALIPTKAQAEGLELTQEHKDNVEESITALAEELGGDEIAEHYLWYFPLTRELYNHQCNSEEYNALMIESHFGEGTDGYPTDAEVVSYLEDEEQCYFFKHILLKVEESTTEDSDSSATSVQTTSNYEEQKALAENLLNQIQSNENPAALFDQLMKEYSEDPGLATYPDGYMGSAKEDSQYASTMVPVVEEACLSMEDGEISGVLENEEGYHGFHIVMRLPLEDAIDVSEYRSYYISDQLTAMQDQWLADTPPVTNSAYHSIDPRVVYEAMDVLRDAITAEAEVFYGQDDEDTSDSSADTSILEDFSEQDGASSSEDDSSVS